MRHVYVRACSKLDMEPKARPSAEQCLDHPLFDDVRYLFKSFKEKEEKQSSNSGLADGSFINAPEGGMIQVARRGSKQSSSTSFDVAPASETRLTEVNMNSECVLLCVCVCLRV